MLMRFVDWAFRDRASGRLVVGQWPNPPLWIFALAQALAWLASADARSTGWAQGVAWIALAIWAADEVIRGVNPWRRGLGGAVLIGMLVRLVL